MKQSKTLTTTLFLLGLAAASLLTPPSPDESGGQAGSRHQVLELLDKAPLYFVENKGQLDKSVTHYLQGRDKTVYFAKEGITYSITRERSEQPAKIIPASLQVASNHDQIERWAVKLDFVGASPRTQVVGENPSTARVSYFKGKSSEWHVGLPTYAVLRYVDLWPGIDSTYSGDGNSLKQEFVVYPGSDPSVIELAYRGAESVTLTDDGRLRINTPLMTLYDDAPMAYQQIAGQQVQVDVRYRLDETRNHYGFEVGSFDRSRPLVIDPAIIVYAGYVGGSGDDQARDVAVDQEGSIYITGIVKSDELTFPETAGPDPDFNGGDRDAYVAKVSHDESTNSVTLDYAGYIGGSGNEQGFRIVVDSEESAYVVGFTETADGSFPTMGGLDNTHAGFSGGCCRDGFISKISSDGLSLVYSGFIGGAGQDLPRGVAVDSSFDAYIVGETSSGPDPSLANPNLNPNLNSSYFPVLIGPSKIHGGFSGGNKDAFVAKVTYNPNTDDADFVYAGYIGGSGGNEAAFGVAVDSDGNAFVTGQTDSTDFPTTTPGPGTSASGGLDVFVAEVDDTGASLIFSGLIGGSSNDQSIGLALDSSGDVYISGQTQSFDFPVTGGIGGSFNGGPFDCFVARVDGSTRALEFATFIGGSGDDRAARIALDSADNIYLAGETTSTEDDFPVLNGPDGTFNSTVPGTFDAFVMKLDPTGSSVLFSGYVGGADFETEGGIAVDLDRNVYIAGATKSDESTFPIKAGPDLIHNGNFDAYVVKIKIGPDLTVTDDPAEFAEGTLAMNSGTFSDPDPGDLVKFAASIGTVTATGASMGTWDWEYLTEDGPDEDQEVTIYACDGTGVEPCEPAEASSSITFDLKVNNFAPSGTFNSLTSAVAGESFDVSITDVTDPSGPDMTAGFTYDFDCGSGFTGSPSASNTATCIATGTTQTVRGKVIDKDDGETIYQEVMSILASQTITFDPLPDVTFGDPPFTVGATSDSGLTVTFVALGACTIDAANNVTATGAGGCTITASQAGDADYAAAPDVQQTFNILQASQTIAFDPLPDVTFGDPPFMVGATSDSGLTVTFVALGACTIDAANNVTATGAGGCTITASQAGDANYAAAPDVQQTFTIFPPPDLQGPVTTDVVADPNPVPIYTSFDLTALISDATTGGSNIAQGQYSVNGLPFVDLNALDGSFDSDTENVGLSIAGFPESGLYDICVRGTDAAGNTGASSCTVLVVYDPDSNVRGHGWINSPTGAYNADPSLTGKAHFNFDSEYEPGANQPTGETRFWFKVADLDFESTSYDWQVVAGARVQYKGNGTINEVGDFKFLLTAIDGDRPGGGGTDKFRIKITDLNDVVIYDNKQGSPDTSDDATELGGGSIHVNK